MLGAWVWWLIREKDQLQKRMDREVAFWVSRTDEAVRASDRVIAVAEDLMRHVRGRGP